MRQPNISRRKQTAFLPTYIAQNVNNDKLFNPNSAFRVKQAMSF